MSDGSCQHSFHDISRHVGEAIVATGMAEGETFVIKAHEVQDRGVEIVDVDGVVDTLMP